MAHLQKDANGHLWKHAANGHLITVPINPDCSFCPCDIPMPAAIELVLSGLDAAICSSCANDFVPPFHSGIVTSLIIDGTYCLPYIGGCGYELLNVGSWAFDYYSGITCDTYLGSENGTFTAGVYRITGEKWSVFVAASLYGNTIFGFRGYSDPSADCFTPDSSILPEWPRTWDCVFHWNAATGKPLIIGLNEWQGTNASIVIDGCVP